MQRWLQATSVGCASDLIQFDIGFLKRLCTSTILVSVTQLDFYYFFDKVRHE